MTAKEFFEHGRELQKEIDKLQEERTCAFEKACGAITNYNSDHVQHSKRNTTEAKNIEYMERQEQLIKLIDESFAYKIKMFKVIYLLEDTTLRAVLLARYINCSTWEDIANRMKYTREHCHKLHRKALTTIAGIIREKEKNKQKNTHAISAEF